MSTIRKVKRQKQAFNYKKVINAVVDRRDKELAKLGTKYRKEVMLPICKKYGILFCVDISTSPYYGYKLIDNQCVITHYQEAVALGYADLAKTLEVLSILVDDVYYFGNFVKAITQKDLRRKVDRPPFPSNVYFLRAL